MTTLPSVLATIIKQKQQEVAALLQQYDSGFFEQKPLFGRNCISLKERLETNYSIIAEHKRKSPSKGIINDKVTLAEVVKGYEQAGAAGVSVLTDNCFFGGSIKDLEQARRLVNIPLLRKDFIINPIQLYQAKAVGADVVLLIAECLTAEKVRNLSKTAKLLGLEVLLEVHSHEQLSKYNQWVDIVGVNNRNLKNFEVSIKVSEKMLQYLPKKTCIISESGIFDAITAKHLQNLGYNGFLIGENFMRATNPGAACQLFVNDLGI